MASSSKILIVTTEMHTAGEPVRIVESGFPKIEGKTILEKRRYVCDNLDHLRRLVMHEPRGHHEMYGALLVTPDHPEAHLAVIFLNNEGYSTMCGHATIALARYAVDRGYVKPITPPETSINIQCPCGLVRAQVRHAPDGHADKVRFQSVPAFVFAQDIQVDIPGCKSKVQLDVSYGGAFYAILPAQSLGLDISKSPMEEIVKWGSTVSAAVRDQLSLSHPDSQELGYLYGTILTDGNDAYSDRPTVNVCIFADGQVDRSPTGSGVTARIALQVAKGQIALGQQRIFHSRLGTEMVGQAIREVEGGPKGAVVVEVEGKAYYTGSCQFTVEDEDPLRFGFLLK